MIGAYFSKPDWHSEYYWWPKYATPDRNNNYDIRKYPWRWEQFKQFTYNQVRELMRNYGTVDILWLDGGWVRPRETVNEEVLSWGARIPEWSQDIGLPRIAAMARKEQPGLLVVDRTVHGLYENYQTPEQHIPKEKLDHPWESCMTLANNWGYVANDRFKPASVIIQKLIEIVAKGGSLLLGIGPGPDGTLPPEAIERLQEIGKWLNKNGSAIYYTRTIAHYQEGNVFFTRSKKGDRMYALLCLPESKPVSGTISWTENLPAKGTKLILLETGQAIPYTIKQNTVMITLPALEGEQPGACFFFSTTNPGQMKSLSLSWVLFLSFLLLCSTVIHAQPSFPFRDEHRSIDNRVADLVSRLTLEEKISLLGYNSKAVPRLGIPAYNWWNEGLHGVARAGLSTVFPQAIGLAATFNDSLLQQVASVISTEARAKYNLAIQLGRREQYMGLTFWSPNINIFRDPRWGRGQETYGEDPFLTATMGVAFVKGLQGSDAHYLKAAAGAKHFAVHSGPEAGRHSFNAIVDEKDLRETYLYAFRKLVDAGVESVMCAYNRVNGQPCCTGDALLKNILRHEWGFRGHVVTDCWALDDIWQQHKTIPSRIAVAAAALKAGVNLDCSDLLQNELLEAIRQQLVTEKEVDEALTALLRTQFKLGFYNRTASVPFHNLGAADVHTPAHVALARKAAQESMVLLKNTNDLLPLDKKNYRSIMVLGPNAGAIDPLLGNYHGVSSGMITFVEGITEAAGPATAVQYDQGSDYSDTLHFGGIWAAGNSDITIAVIGLTPVMEGEEGDAFLAANGGDKISLDIPPAHLALLKALRKESRWWQCSTAAAPSI